MTLNRKDAEEVQREMSEINGLATMAKVQAMSTGISSDKLPAVPSHVEAAKPASEDKVELKHEADGSVDVDALMKTIGGALTPPSRSSGSSKSGGAGDLGGLMGQLKDVMADVKNP